MTIHKEGYAIITIVFFGLLLINAGISWWLKSHAIVNYFVYAASFLFFIFILYFFRLPSIEITPNNDIVLCPADGKIVIIEEVEEPEYFKDKRLQVSVFMSPFNVHVNRYPMSGVVKYLKYHPGKHIVAFHPKSSVLNERTSIVIENEKGISILTRQIAGTVARRIVYYPEQGDSICQGDELGFIKFGSRVDLFLPLGTELNIKTGQHVKGGKTIIANLK